MAVIIREFEIVPEPAQSEPAAPQAGEQTPVTPHDIEAAVRRHAERELRLWAH